MPHSLRFAPAALFFASLFSVAALAADDLELKLLETAPSLVETLREAGCESVGVLKFHVRKGAGPASDRVGELNRRLSEKLELALILKNGATPEQQVLILRDAGKTAATIPGAAHTSAAGRKLLFTKDYDPAWGKEPVAPQAFIIGEAALAADLKTMDLFLRIFTRNNPDKLVELCKISDVKLDLEDLLEAGESFTVRGVFDKGQVLMAGDARKDAATATAVQTALLVKPSQTPEPVAPTTPAASSKGHPLSPDSEAPVALEIYYGDNPQNMTRQPLQFQGGIAFVAGPREGQKVFYVVRRKGADRRRLGVVLKVNGENTLYKERLSDAQCTPWVLEADKDAFGVYGYQLKNANQLEEFKVLSTAESKAREVEYGEHVGLVSISVFPEKPAELVKLEETQQTQKAIIRETNPETLKVADGDDFAILNRAEFPANPRNSLKELKGALLGLAEGTRSRGLNLIAAGEKRDQKLEFVKFVPDNIPLMSATVRYYDPSDLPK